MTPEKLIRANAIESRLQTLHDQHKNLSTAVKFTDGSVSVTNSSNQKSWIYTSFLDLEVIKAISLSKIDKEIAALQAEFEAL